MEQSLKNRAFHSWVDPRGLAKQDWEWAELNAFHSADVARQLLEEVESNIATAEYLRRKERGEVDTDKFKEIWSKVKEIKKDVMQS